MTLPSVTGVFRIYSLMLQVPAIMQTWDSSVIPTGQGAGVDVESASGHRDALDEPGLLRSLPGNPSADIGRIPEGRQLLQTNLQAKESQKLWIVFARMQVHEIAPE